MAKLEEVTATVTVWTPEGTDAAAWLALVLEDARMDERLTDYKVTSAPTPKTVKEEDASTEENLARCDKDSTGVRKVSA